MISGVQIQGVVKALVREFRVYSVPFYDFIGVCV